MSDMKKLSGEPKEKKYNGLTSKILISSYFAIFNKVSSDFKRNSTTTCAFL